MTEDAEKFEARLRQVPGQQEEWLRQDNLIYGGLIAGGGVLVQPFLTAASLDLSATISVVAFSISIPLLAALLMVGQQETFRHRPAGSRVVAIAKAVAQGLAIVGVAAAFWHVTWIAGVGIIVSALVGLGVHTVGYTRLIPPGT
jgi:hypothetical protein